MSYYAVEIIGTGKKSKFVVKKVIRDGYIVTTSPAIPGAFRTMNDAITAAESNGIKIEKTGDAYQII